MKKLFSVLLVLAIVVTMIPMSVFANEENPALSEPAQNVLVAEPSAEAPTETVPVEEPQFDTEQITDCVCGGAHNGENQHECHAVTWTALSDANRLQYFTSTRITTDTYLRLTEDITNNATTITFESCTLAIDLAGHTLTLTGSSRLANIYYGGVFSLCDSVGGGKVLLNQSKDVSSASLLWFQSPGGKDPSTASDYEYAHIFGGTIERTGVNQTKPAILQYANNTHTAIYDGVCFRNIANGVTATANSQQGGLIMLNGANSTLYVGACTFDTVSCNGKGGVIFMNNGTLTIDGATFQNCSSVLNGGVIHKAAGSLKMKNATFSGCSTLGKDSASTGGVIYQFAGGLEIEDCVFENNTSGTTTRRNGGAIQISGGTSGKTISITGSRFTGNAGAYGGAFYTSTSLPVTISDCTFTDNTATGGGALGISGAGAVATITNCTMTGNISSNDGGAIYISSTSTADITDSTITNNHSTCATARFQASGIALRQSSTVNLSGNTIIYNNTGMGANAKNLDIIAEAQNATDLVRTVNINQLTGDGYVVVNPSTNSSGKEMVINNNGENALDDSTAGVNIYYLTHDTPLYDGDVEIQILTGAEEYLSGTDMELTVEARLTDTAAYSEAYIKSASASEESEHTAASETVLKSASGAPLKISKTNWTKLGTLNVSIDSVLQDIESEQLSVTAKLTAQATDASELSVSATAQIAVKYDPNAHMHCICGKNDACTYTDHESLFKVYKKITNSNLQELNGMSFQGPKQYYFYLDEDITISSLISIGSKSGAAAEVYLCLNGHTITVTANRLFHMINGTVTVCDCQGGGTIQSRASTTPANGCLVFFANANNSAGTPTFTMYGGTLQYAEDATLTSSHGLLMTQGNGVANLYGVTVDGKNKGVTPTTSSAGANGVTALEGTVTMTDCIVRNCTAPVKNELGGKGSALYVGSKGEVTLKNCTFENNTADLCGGAIFATGNQNLNLAGNMTFTGNTANAEENDIYLTNQRKLNLDNITSSEKIKVRVAEDGNYGSASAEDFAKIDFSADNGAEVELIDGKIVVSKYTTDHPHCYCGGDCSVGGHTHVQKTKWVACDDASQLSGKVFTGETWLYLTEDITVSENVQIGNKTDEGILRICLNGHKITVTFKRMFDVRNGVVSVCDCQGSGSIESLSNQRPNAGCIVMWLNDSYSVPGATFELYGGTLTYDDGASNISDYGIAYCTYGGIFSMYGGTIDGKNFGTVGYGNGNGSGGITADVNGTVNIYGGTIRNCAATIDENYKTGGNGGAILIKTRSTLNVTGGVFENNTAEKWGGALYQYDTSNASKSTIENASFRNNSSGESGGAICINNGTIEVSNTTFDDNHAKKSAGAIQTTSTNQGQIRNCTFTNNTCGEITGASGNGGAVFLTGQVQLAGRNTFINNYAHGYGGALYIASPRTIANAMFDGNGCDMRGGAVLASSSSKNVTFIGCTFTNNEAQCGWEEEDRPHPNNGEYGGGGGINSNANTVINNCTFESNVAWNKGGGAVEVNRKVSLLVSNSTFKKNVMVKNYPYGATGGGAILHDCGYYVNDPYYDCKIINCLFEENEAEGNYGGAVMVRHANAWVENTTFIANKGHNGSAYACGRTAKNYFKNVKFLDNEATGMGATIIQGDCTFTLEYGEYVGNYSKGSGAGICLYNAVGATIKKGLFTGNRSGASGGAIYARSKDKPTVIEYASCYDNVATNYGGAVYVYGEMTIEDCEIYKNLAKKGGGGISTASLAELTIHNAHVYQNKAIGNGGAISTTGYLTINGGIFENNHATSNGGAFANSGSGAYRTYTKLLGDTIVRNNKADKNGGALFTAHGFNLAEIDGAKVYANEAGEDGGAFYQKPETLFKLASGEIYGNTCAGNGGALYGQGQVKLLGGSITGNKAGGIGGAAYLSNEAADDESYQHNVFILGAVKASANHAGKANELYLTDTAAALIDDSVLTGGADFDLTIGGNRAITKTVHGAYNFRKLGNNTYHISDASNAARPSEVDENGVAHIIGDYVPVKLPTTDDFDADLTQNPNQTTTTEEETEDTLVENDNSSNLGDVQAEPAADPNAGI